MDREQIKNIISLAAKIYGVHANIDSKGIVDDLYVDKQRNDKNHAIGHTIKYLTNRGITISKKLIDEYKKDAYLRVGLYVGSFNPFTIGHANIVERALSLFDKLVIGVGMNPEKTNWFNADNCLKAICHLYQDNDNITANYYSGLTTEFAKEVGADFIIKGVRNSNDFEYERTQAEINKKLSGIETILLYSVPELSCVSSSAFRQLQMFGKDATWMIPEPIRDIEKYYKHLI